MRVTVYDLKRPRGWMDRLLLYLAGLVSAILRS